MNKPNSWTEWLWVLRWRLHRAGHHITVWFIYAIFIGLGVMLIVPLLQFAIDLLRPN